VYKRTFNVREYLDLILKLLADIMSFPQRCIGIHDNVNFHKIFLIFPLDALKWTIVQTYRSAVIGANGINLYNVFAKRCCLVNQELKEIMWGRFSGEEFELTVNSSAPRYNDAHSNLYEGNEFYVSHSNGMIRSMAPPMGSRTISRMSGENGQ
jgi:hypothetical protein